MLGQSTSSGSLAASHSVCRLSIDIAGLSRQYLSRTGSSVGIAMQSAEQAGADFFRQLQDAHRQGCWVTLPHRMRAR